MMQTDVLGQLKDFMSHCQAGDWIYPAKIHRELRMDVVTVYELLEFLASKNYVTPYLQVSCPNCERSFHYKTVGELPSEISCENCNYKIVDPINHATVIYQVN